MQVHPLRPPTPTTPPGTAAVGGTSSEVLVHGPRWYRARIRWLGPVLALLPPAAIGLAGLALLRLGESRVTGVSGLVTGLWAAPGLLVLGAPLSTSSSYPLGIAISVVAWLIVGFVAARRATRDPMADFGQFWRQYLWAAAGILVGVAAALVVVGVVYGEALL